MYCLARSDFFLRQNALRSSIVKSGYSPGRVLEQIVNPAVCTRVESCVLLLIVVNLY